MRPWEVAPKKPCGSYAAYRRHVRKGEIPDEACVEARKKYFRDRGNGVKASAAAVGDAASMAVEALINRHQAEFDALLRECLAELRREDAA